MKPDMPGTGGSSRLLRMINERAALGCLFLRGPLTRPELVELTGFSKPTASEVIKRLRAADLVTVTGQTSGGPGPRADVYGINPDASYGAAVSIREPDGLDIVVGDLDGNIRERTRLRVRFEDVAVADAVAAAVRRSCSQGDIPIERLRQVWIGVPGSYNARLDRVRNIDVPGFDRAGLLQSFQERISASVHIDNDVNLAALAERHHGSGGDEGFVLLWLGERGIGVGVDVGNGLLQGFRGAAGEIGYLPIGKSGLQELAGGPAIMELSRYSGRPAATAEAAMHAAVAANDTTFMTEVARRLTPGLCALAAVADPAMIVVSGEMGLAGAEPLCAALTEALRDTAFDIPVLTSPVSEDPVLRGGLDAALAALRDDLLAEPAGR